MKAIYLRYIQYHDFMEDINRLKLVLVEKKKTGKWLAEQLGKNPSTISKWCSNVSQPDLATLVKVANLLEVDVQELINKTTMCHV
jgi:transcriptional regulator with XRE-family HTH domain